MTRAKIDIRIRRIMLGNIGDCKAIGEGVFEIRIDFGPGYRVYFIRKQHTLIVLLAGGDKSTQTRDIQKAKELARATED